MEDPALRTAVRTTAFIVEELKTELRNCRFENTMITQKLNELSDRLSSGVEYMDGFGSVSDDGIGIKDVMDASKWRDKDLMNVDKIIQAVFNEDIKKQTVDIDDRIPEEKREYLEFDAGDDENFVDPEQPLKDTMTNLVTTQFLRHNAANKRFLTVVINIFNTAVDLYKRLYERKYGTRLEEKDLIFMYKGGNVLRVIYHTYLNEQPRIVTELVQKTFSDYFKKSDADFQIYIGPDIAHYDKVYEDIQLISYLLLVRIRHIYTINPYLTLNFDKLKDEFQKDILTKIVNDVNDLHMLQPGYTLGGKPGDYAGAKLINLVYGDLETGKIPEGAELVDDTRLRANFETYMKEPGSKRPDIAIVKHPHKNYTAIYKLMYLNRLRSAAGLDLIDKEIQEGLYGDADRDMHYISWNNSIDIMKRGTFKLKFALVRMKINMKGFFQFPNGKIGCLNMGGEFIDVSIPHREATETGPFYAHYNDYVQKLKISISSDNSKIYPGMYVTYDSYTLRYFIKDLHKMLYDEPLYPWHAHKYEKRLYRTGVLSMLDTLYVIMGQDPTIASGLSYSQKLDIYRDDITKYKDMLEGIKEDRPRHRDPAFISSEFKYKNADGSISYQYHNAYQSCRINELITDGAFSNPDNVDKMNEYLDSLIEVQNTILNVIRAKKKYIEDGNLDESTLKSYRSIIQAEQHGGSDPYYKKYLKYKTKYMKIKK